MDDIEREDIKKGLRPRPLFKVKDVRSGIARHMHGWEMYGFTERIHDKAEAAERAAEKYLHMLPKMVDSILSGVIGEVAVDLISSLYLTISVGENLDDENTDPAKEMTLGLELHGDWGTRMCAEGWFSSIGSGHMTFAEALDCAVRESTHEREIQPREPHDQAEYVALALEREAKALRERFPKK